MHRLPPVIDKSFKNRDYTNSTFKENKIDIRTKTMVKEVKDKVIVAQNEKKEIVEYPYGLLVW